MFSKDITKPRNSETKHRNSETITSVSLQICNTGSWSLRSILEYGLRGLQGAFFKVKDLRGLRTICKAPEDGVQRPWRPESNMNS